MTALLFVDLYSSSPTGLRAQTAAAADETMRRGATILALGIDNLAALDDAAISATIVALRRLREIGGTVRLVTRNAAHLKRLAQTGLDHVFDVMTLEFAPPNGESLL